MLAKVIKWGLFLFMLVQLPLALSATTDTNREPAQAPIRVLEYKFPRNTPQEPMCAPGQCPESTTPRDRRPQKLPTPTKLTPKKLSPAGGTSIPVRPAAKFIPPLPVDGQPNVPKQLLLLFPNSGIANTRIQAIKQQYGLSPIEHINLDALSAELVVYNTDERSPLDLKKSLGRIAPEATIELNYYYLSLKGPRQYFSKKIKMAMPANTNNKIPVGIIDTAVKKTPALAHATIVQKNFTSPSNKQANTTHGTSVALLIAGKDEKNSFYGVTPESPLFVASIMRKVNQHNNTNSLLLAQALNWLVTQQVKVINLSLGGPKDAIMANIFTQLKKQPIVLVAAAGNSGPKAPPSYPAAYPGVIAVTASNANNQIYRHANQGSYIDITAPGEDIWVPITNSGQYVSGTSFSAALASGVISKLISTHAVTNAESIKKMLCDQAIDLGVTGHDNTYGCGLLQNMAPQNKTHN